MSGTRRENWGRENTWRREGANNVMSPSSLFDTTTMVRQIHSLTKGATLAAHKHQSSNILTAAYVGDWFPRKFIFEDTGVSQRRGVGGEVARKNKLTVGILSNTMFYSLDLSLHWGNLSGNWLWWRKCNLVVAPLLHTVNIFISSEALCRSSSEIAFCVFTNNLHWCKMKHEVYSYTTSLPGIGTN